MSDTQTAWTVLWQHALQTSPPGSPFETDTVVPKVAAALKADEATARKVVALLMKELTRLPDGRRFFRLEGNAIVPLPAFAAAVRRGQDPLAAYPFEL